MNNPRPRIACVIGTRPEAIKMAPLIRRLKQADWCECTVLCTAQHRELVDQVLGYFHIRPCEDFGVMRPNQSLATLTSRLIEQFDEVLLRSRPDAVVAQGDTTTTLAAALSSFYHRVPFGHVEAGLRTGNLYGPYPEEMNRLVVSRIARWHFAPTQMACGNLLSEGVDPASVHTTGNTVIDALLEMAEQADAFDLPPGARLVLVTAHRRENFGRPLENVCRAIRQLADTRGDVVFLYPVHPNPNVQRVVSELLAGHPRIRLVPPLDYPAFVAAMKRAYFILTDSGGVQEEAPALGKPVLVLREETERPEAVAAGVVRLVGTDAGRILAESTRLLDDAAYHAGMARGDSPYGDGHAAERITAVLKQALCIAPAPAEPVIAVLEPVPTPALDIAPVLPEILIRGLPQAQPAAP